MSQSNEVILAFSGGLDTSFCVPWLIEQGYEVVTAFVDTGGVSDAEREYIETRARELGAKDHVVLDAGFELFDQFVLPFLWAGQRYQNAYPLLCSDRYIIVQKCLELADERGTKRFAHGCTGMGNDQVRFDVTVRALGDYEILAPIREIQKAHDNVRDFEQAYLAERGFEVRPKTGTYTINENLLGVTTSGSEVDEWKEPGPQTYQLCRPRSEWPAEPLTVDILFEDGMPNAVDGHRLDGVETLTKLNELFGAYGVGRGMYTGDTTIGLKGRIVYEAPGLTALLVAHKALEEAVLTKHQNRFKPVVGQKWVELTYEGFFFEPLIADLEEFLRSSQAKVSGIVTLKTDGGVVHPVAVDSDNILRREGATYAQSADWDATEAEGFIKLLGQSTTLWSQVDAAQSRKGWK